MGAGLAEVSELKAIEMEVRKSVDNDVKKVAVFHVKFCVKGSFYGFRNGLFLIRLWIRPFIIGVLGVKSSSIYLKMFW